MEESTRSLWKIVEAEYKAIEDEEEKGGESSDDRSSDDRSSDSSFLGQCSDSEEEKNRPPPYDTNTPWPPVWKPISESPQFLCGMLMFVESWGLETRPTIADVDIHQKLITRSQQIRDSRGYDFDWNAPKRLVGDPFFLVDIQEDRYFQKRLSELVPFVVGEINAHSERFGKRYEAIKVEKLVIAQAHLMRLITFTVKEFSVKEDAAAENMDVDAMKTIQAMVYAEEWCNLFRLCEWRFKPEAT